MKWRVAYLKEQHSDYVARAPTRRYKFPFPAKVGMGGGVVESVAHLTELVGKMIEHGTVDTAIDH